MPIDNNLISFSSYRRTNVRSVRGCNRRQVVLTLTCAQCFLGWKRTILFCHGKCGTNFTVQQRNKPFLLLFRGTISCQNLCRNGFITWSADKTYDRTHVARIRRRTVDSFRGHLPATPKNFCHYRILHVADSAEWSKKAPRSTQLTSRLESGTPYSG